MAKHSHSYQPAGSPHTVVIGNEQVTYQRMECACGDAYNAIVARHKIDPNKN